MTSRLTRVRVVLRITCLLVSLLPGAAFGSSITITPTPLPAGAATTAAAASTGQATNVVINEILAHTDAPQVDSIELYNPTAAPIAIGGWFLSDDGDVLDRYQIPPEVTIPAGGYQVFTAAELGFALNEFGETVFLYAPDPDGRPQTRVDHVKFGVSPNGISFGRYETSTGAVHYPLQRALSLGEANAGPLVSDLVITEIMYHPAAGTAGSEYLIIVNRSNAEFLLFDVLHPDNRWKINVDGKDVFVFPAGTRLAPSGAVVIAGTTPATLRSEYRVPASMQVMGPFSGKLSNEGERIALLAPQPPEVNMSVAYAEMDGVTYSPEAPWPTAASGGGAALRRLVLGGYADDPASWQAGQPLLDLQMTMFLPMISN